MIAKEGGYEKFSRGYERFGFQVEKDGIAYQEWAPNAVEAFLFGEFSKKKKSCLEEWKNDMRLGCKVAYLLSHKPQME